MEMMITYLKSIILEDGMGGKEAQRKQNTISLESTRWETSASRKRTPAVSTCSPQPWILSVRTDNGEIRASNIAATSIVGEILTSR